MRCSSVFHVKARFEYESGQLLKDLYNLKPSPAKTASLAGCKEIISKNSYDSIASFNKVMHDLERYAAINYREKVWSDRYDKKWKPSRFRKQLAALKMAKQTGLDLASCADNLGTNFRGFHFSYPLLEELYPSTVNRNLSRPPEVSFENLEADGCFIERRWGDVISSFRKAKLKEAKFYDSGDYVVPGANLWEKDFSEADLSGVDLRFSYLRGCNFMGAAMHGANLHDSDVFECCFHRVSGVFYLCSPGKKFGDEIKRYNKIALRS
jgi:uncharacterized protein YjbI with pentapeptide repeats